MQLALTLDLKQFIASLEKVEGVSKETISQLQQMFSQVPSLKVPVDTKQIKEAYNQIGSGSNRAAQGVLSLNYIIRDSPYFFNNFNMGIMAIGNNLNPFIDQMLRAKQKTGSWTGALNELKGGLIGVGGVSFAFSIVVSLIQAFSFAAAKGESEQKKMALTVSKLSEEYKTLSERIADTNREISSLDVNKLESALRGLRKEAESLNDEFDRTMGIATFLSASPFGNLLLGLFGASPKDLANLSLNRAQVDATLEAMTSLGNNMHTIRDLFNDGKISTAVNIFTQKELSDLGNKFREIADTTLPDMYKELDLNGVQFFTTGKQAKKLAEAIDGLNKKHKEKKNLITTDDELLKQLKEIEIQKRVTTSENEKLRLLEKELEIRKQLSLAADKQIKDIIDADILDAKNNLGPDEDPTGSAIKLNSKLNTTKDALNAVNKMLKEQLDLYQDIKSIGGSVGRELLNTWTSSFQLLKRNQTMLEQFINALARAVVQTLALRLAMTALDFFTGGIFGAVSSAAGAVVSQPAGSLSRPSSNLLNTVRSQSTFINNSISNKPIVQTVVLETQARGRDLYFIQKKEESYRRKYYGASE
jgi:hypothetical protein